MKKLVTQVAILVCFASFAKAADEARCDLYVNNAYTESYEVLHQDYDVKITGNYQYRPYISENFYELDFTYLTSSNPGSKQLTMVVSGGGQTANTNVVLPASGDYHLSATVVDSRNNQLTVHCGIY